MTHRDATEAPPPSSAPSPPRRLGGDRSRLLALAAHLTAPTPASHDAVAHVTMERVAERAGVARAALHRLWPSPADFWDELVEHVLTGPAHQPAPVVPGESLPPSVLDPVQEALLADPLPLLRAGVVGHPLGDRHVAVLARHRDAMVTLLQVGAEARLGTRRRPVAGLTTADLAVAMTIAGNGLPVTARLVRSDLLHLEVDGDGPRRGLLRVIGRAVFNHLVEEGPAEEGPSPPPTPPPSASPSHDGAAGRRREYLALAAGLALRPAPDGLDRVLGHIGLDRLARVAGVPHRTLTDLWPDRTAFRLDLFSHLLARERGWLLDAIATAHDLAEDADPLGASLSLGNALHDAVQAHLGEVSHLAFAPHLEQPPLAERARRDHDALLDACARALDRLLSAVGRRVRPGIRVQSLAVVLTTLADGTTRVGRTRPELLRDDIPFHGGRHSLTGCVVAAVLHDLTEPIEVGGPGADLARLLG